MNEYYYIRYNLYKYFLNIDDDNYNTNLSIIITILYIILILLSLFALLLLQNITGFTIIYIILLVFYYIITYKLIISLKSISTNETLIKYKNFYELRNIIFKENLKYALDVKNVETIEEINYLKSNKDTIIKNINNTENIYGKEANKLLNSSYDLLKYFDLNEYIEKGFYNRLYIENLNFIQTSLPYIIRHPTETKIVYINFELLEDYPTQQKELLKYLDLKYNKKLSFTSKNIFTADFNKKLNNTISNYKTIIYYYIAISVCFIIILLHGLFVYFNRTLASIYFSLIIIALIVLYYYN